GLMAFSLLRSRFTRKWVPAAGLVALAALAYVLNFSMAADAMFAQLPNPKVAMAAQNSIDTSRLVLGVVVNGQARAYPIQVLGYHHFVQDTLGGKPILPTYCTVCRTGRVYEPLVDGSLQQFRLVGMDHFNAMIEDKATKSWWQQATGQAVAGPQKGKQLPEVASVQTSLNTWLTLHPQSTILQMDAAFANKYDTSFKYESGKSRKALTGTNDSASWQHKSWVIGVSTPQGSVAFDWRQLQKENLLMGKAGSLPVMLVLAKDGKSFFAFERPADGVVFAQDTLYANLKRFRIDGTGIDTTGNLKPLPAYQEFWHSWQHFQPGTAKQQ
ncbi:MAG TPA: DUF3179 domain-containing (seleno)protein, partial [Phnomibacter sp.]|nr:DUF3179 domain-containing (seleno)protein [Phnomibacter sp.]